MGFLLETIDNRNTHQLSFYFYIILEEMDWGILIMKKLQMGKKMDIMPLPCHSVSLGFRVQNKCGVKNTATNVLGSS